MNERQRAAGVRETIQLLRHEHDLASTAVERAYLAGAADALSNVLLWGTPEEEIRHGS
ncbi:hypothetical protein [Tsukamurella strandjordii]|uniref:Uncharacterized protein n=1 Tax=Tsukamurella strandjordii TaxID=147577 RepID=A0AA90NQN1_9ACTN|nr:hypothetical protein [Tsukamurella strandjordii]MDP0398929.1 hypothetical protein [Tsukamurella strandjordii]